MRFGIYATAIFGAIMMVNSVEGVRLNIEEDKKDDAAADSACKNCCPKVECGKCPCDADKSLFDRVMESANSKCVDCKDCKKMAEDPTEKCEHCPKPVDKNDPANQPPAPAAA